jgi:hypothetical protein
MGGLIQITWNTKHQKLKKLRPKIQQHIIVYKQKSCCDRQISSSTPLGVAPQNAQLPFGPFSSKPLQVPPQFNLSNVQHNPKLS